MKIKIVNPWSLILILFLIRPISGQELKKVSGIVTSFNNIPLIKAHIYALKAGTITLSDSTGRFFIGCFSNDILKVTAAGFGDKKIRTDKESILRIDLVYNDNEKNFNEAVSNGHISEAVLKEAIKKQESKYARDYSKYKSIYELISSEIYSVKVNGNVILNKKVKSFDSTPEVLLVVDDKIVRDISFVNPADVRSIEFIEDVGATIYGSMGANGVLKITLK